MGSFSQAPLPLVSHFTHGPSWEHTRCGSSGGVRVVGSTSVRAEMAVVAPSVEMAAIIAARRNRPGLIDSPPRLEVLGLAECRVPAELSNGPIVTMPIQGPMSPER